MSDISELLFISIFIVCILILLAFYFSCRLDYDQISSKHHSFEMWCLSEGGIYSDLSEKGEMLIRG